MTVSGSGNVFLPKWHQAITRSNDGLSWNCLREDIPYTVDKGIQMISFIKLYWLNLTHSFMMPSIDFCFDLYYLWQYKYTFWTFSIALVAFVSLPLVGILTHHNGTLNNGHVPWWPFMRFTSWCFIFKSGPCNSFDDRGPEDEIHGCPIFKCLAVTLQEW